MPTIVVGDIHGELAALDDLLAQLRSSLQADCTLVFVGDYIDRGPDSRGVVQRIIDLRASREFPVIALLGNHEQWMRRTMADFTRHSWLLGMEAFETVSSYSLGAAEVLLQAVENAGPKLFTARVSLPYNVFFDAVPPAHLAFFASLLPCARTADVVCAHAGVAARGDPLAGAQDPTQEDVFVWGADGFPANYQGAEKVVYGHWGNAIFDTGKLPRPCILPNGTYGLDSIGRGVLTAIRFPDEVVYHGLAQR